MVKAVLVTSRGNIAGTQGITTAGATQYWWLGQATLSPSAAEANRAPTWRTSGVISKLYVRVVANSTTAQSTVTVRKNTANTDLVVNIPAGQTGVFETTGETLTIVDGDKTCYRTVSGGTGTLQFSILSCLFDAATNCVTKLFAWPYAINTPSATHYLIVTGTFSGTTAVEANVEHTIKVAGTAKNAYLYVAANTRTTDTTYTLRKNRADTAITFTFTGGETGVKEDTSNQISYSVDDKIDWKIVTGIGTGTVSVGLSSSEFETSSQGWLDAGTVGGSADITIGPGVTEYYSIGAGVMEGVTNEADAQVSLRVPTILTNLTVFARANTITAPTTLRLRINGVDGNQVVNIGPSTTGFIVDTTHTDVVQSNDVIDYQIITGATGTTLTIAQIAIWSAAQEVVPVVGSAGRSQGRSPLYKTRTRPRDSQQQKEIAAAVIVRVKIALEYEVEKLSVQIPLPYTIQRPRPIVKYASAILSPIAHILPLPVRPTPPLPTIVKVRLTLPLAYEVTSLRPQLKAACSYQVDKLITQEQQNKLRILAVNFLASNSDL